MCVEPVRYSAKQPHGGAPRSRQARLRKAVAAAGAVALAELTGKEPAAAAAAAVAAAAAATAAAAAAAAAVVEKQPPTSHK